MAYEIYRAAIRQIGTPAAIIIAAYESKGKPRAESFLVIPGGR